jgi:nicotinamide mononucleotide adenylyltransferase
MTYKIAATIGRFNIPHSGHVDLVRKLLEYGEIAKVFVTTGPKNNSWQKRATLLRLLCSAHGLDLTRLQIAPHSNPYSVAAELSALCNPEEVLIILGEDRKATLEDLENRYTVSTRSNPRLSSSTEVRVLLDKGDLTLARHYPNYKLHKLAQDLREEERVKGTNSAVRLRERSL